jgi:FtsP/CotA-like multicopper oxidase with cupredoxin domain
MSDQIPRDLGSPFNPLDPAEFQEFEEFGCPPNTEDIVADLLDAEAETSRAHRLLDSEAIIPRLIQEEPGFLPTPDPVQPDLVFERQGMDRDQAFSLNDAGTVEMWSFNNDNDDFVWPGSTIRIKEGSVAHTLMSNSRGVHTVHHHGLEPTAVNDGVGHLTFDVQGAYNYQWLAREAGTYFYHCHVNTVLHFEMGMYGMLIIDPDVPGAPFTDGGHGFVYVGNTLTPYQVEAIWVADDIDRRWHAAAIHGHDRRAGIICGDFQSIDDEDNPEFHRFEPDVFVVSGKPPEVGQRTLPEARQSIAAAGVTVARGLRLLVRALNASYTTTRWRFPVSLPGQIIAADGRTLGRSPSGAYSSPYTLASIGHQLTLTTAQRRDILIDTSLAATGQHLVEIDFHHWITDEIFDYGRLTLVITVS